MSEAIEPKSPIKSVTLWGLFVAWLGVKMQVALTGYEIPTEMIDALSGSLTELGLIAAAIGRVVATKVLRT